ncbi:MAG: peptidyl-prolyl cis-trans isomerase, partial [Granulosicoccus sp.]|nr:peptidyl-prolyl cis-trans isomerase [Granulosicoccus sp.]
VQSADGFHIIRVDGKRVGDRETQIETRARHIFISTAADGTANPEDAQATLLETRRKLQAGADFAALAEELSDDPNSAGKGGELPWFTPGQMPKAMEQQASQLEPGELSQPFQTQFGWHLLEVLERRDASLSEERNRREAELGIRTRKLEQETDRWSRRLRSEAFVEILK